MHNIQFRKQLGIAFSLFKSLIPILKLKADLKFVEIMLLAVLNVIYI